jgi:hypothetical protein
MSWGFVAAGAATVIGGAMQADAAGDASDDANATSRYATDEQRRQFDLTREDYRPYREAGYDALGRMRDLLGFDPTPTDAEVVSEPGYQFGLQQGRNVLEGSAAARGGLYSGQAAKELTQFGNDYGSTRYQDAWNRRQQAFGNRWNRLAGLAGVGQAATGSTAAAGQHYADAAGNIAMNNANVQGAAGMARAGIWGDALNQFGGMALNRWGKPNGGMNGDNTQGWTFAGNSPGSNAWRAPSNAELEAQWFASGGRVASPLRQVGMANPRGPMLVPSQTPAAQPVQPPPTTMGGRDIAMPTRSMPTARSLPVRGAARLRMAFENGGTVNGPAGIDKVPAWLTDDEYVLDVDTVREIGGGNAERGHNALDRMRKRLGTYKRRA